MTLKGPNQRISISTSDYWEKMSSKLHRCSHAKGFLFTKSTWIQHKIVLIFETIFFSNWDIWIPDFSFSEISRWFLTLKTCLKVRASQIKKVFVWTDFWAKIYSRQNMIFTAKRKLDRLQFSTSSSFVKIWSACSCEFKAYFWTFWTLYHLLFDLETIGVN